MTIQVSLSNRQWQSPLVSRHLKNEKPLVLGRALGCMESGKDGIIGHVYF